MPFHLFALVVSLSGQPMGIVESMEEFPTKEECALHKDEFAAKVSQFVRLNNILGSVKGVACATEDEADGKSKQEESF